MERELEDLSTELQAAVGAGGRNMTNDELAQAWELAADYLDFAAEWCPEDIPEEVADRIKVHVMAVVQPFLYNKAAIIRRNAKLGKRR